MATMSPWQPYHQLYSATIIL